MDYVGERSHATHWSTVDPEWKEMKHGDEVRRPVEPDDGSLQKFQAQAVALTNRHLHSRLVENHNWDTPLRTRRGQMGVSAKKRMKVD